jgi:HPt (histidine-containing phosphotransfer) domain-containing protein
MPGPSPQDSLQPFSFAGSILPCEDYEVEGGLRDHVHEYSHVDGGDPEKFGRSLYQITATINFQAKLTRYPGLWPNILNALTTMWEQGTTSTLVVPSIGPIQAYALKWNRKWTARVRSGERVTLRFREDATNLPLPITVSQPSPASIATGASALSATLAQAQGLDTTDTNLFDQLQTLVNSLTAVTDTASLYGNLVAARVQQLISLCQQIDALPHMQSPLNWPVMEALHQVWGSSVQYSTDLQSQNLTLSFWTVPTLMTIAAISVRLYGDSSQVPNLLANNTGAFADPLAIPAGTEIAYYPSVASLALSNRVSG